MACRQQVITYRVWGGKRRGAGRKARGPRPSERHRTRPRLSRQHPVHVTIRVVAEVGRLRKHHAYQAARRALVTTMRRTDFRICHLSIQNNHIHLLVEADHEMALARGMQGFEVSCAKHLNAALSRILGVRRRGQVFPDRYHAQPLRTPRQVRNALAYVLNNWRRHGEDGRERSAARFDRFSTGACADVWLGERRQVIPFPPIERRLPVSFPKSWLLSTGWQRHGRIDPFERPGIAHDAR